MIIDFHVHVFPDKIAGKTIEYLSAKGGIPAHSDGTLSGLKSAIESAGVDIAVALPVVTNPAQFDSINRFALGINESFSFDEGGVLSFGGIHPACDNIGEKMKQLKDMGFLGIKLHPDYQGTYFDDEGYVEIIKWAKELDLIVVTHAGYDVGYPGEPIKCTPERVKRLLSRVSYSKLCLAHLGGNELLNDVYDLICGEDIYLDTAYVLPQISKELFIKIMDKHGDDKILFATDSPWNSIKNDVEIIKSFSPGKQSLEKILCQNALKLLGRK